MKWLKDLLAECDTTHLVSDAICLAALVILCVATIAALAAAI